MAVRDALVIKNEQEAWEALQLALAGQISETAQISFKGWPVFRMTIKGEDFDGSIPTRVMPPIFKLQAEIHRIYCHAKYQTDDTRRLKQEERDQLELVVNIEKGSTKFITDIANALNQIIKSSNMNGRQALILLATTGAMITSTVTWKDWLQTKERLHGEEITVKMSQEETRRLELVTKALTAQPELRKAQESIDDFKSDLSKRLKAEDKINVAGESVIDGVRAAKIVPTPDVEAREIRLDGNFEINALEFPEQSGGVYRFTVTEPLSGQPLIVDAAPNVLTEQERMALYLTFSGSFQGSISVFMKVNARQGRSGITGANLVSISWSKAPADDQ